jgi:hypothetical protein
MHLNRVLLFLKQLKEETKLVKKAIIEIILVDESVEKTNKEIGKEISKELSDNLHIIPWAAKIENMTIRES